MTIWYILRRFARIYGRLVCFEVIWYIFPRFGILDQEKSGNPVDDPSQKESLEPTTASSQFWLAVDKTDTFFL
jgi:hypothetical protein